MQNDKLPSCKLYAYYLNKTVKKFNISINEARQKIGKLTVTQVNNLLNN